MIDFAIVGQAKSGTTALAEYLGEHPRICMSVPKEPAYFATDLRQESDSFHGSRKYFEFRTEEDYAAAFAHGGAGELLGAASNASLFSKVAPPNLKAVNPELRVLIMLREPVSFMHS